MFGKACPVDWLFCFWPVIRWWGISRRPPFLSSCEYICILSVCRLLSCILVFLLLFGYLMFYGWVESSIDHKYPAPVILPFPHRIPGGHAIHLNFACISVVSPNPFPFPFSALSPCLGIIFLYYFNISVPIDSRGRNNSDFVFELMHVLCFPMEGLEEK
ncbi:hypothetical protein DFP73DRAFT_112909 [Morchella snyderi]|nr:hypothetical protein DFP73DRAFT_112909 [Morchella snyderi]